MLEEPDAEYCDKIVNADEKNVHVSFRTYSKWGLELI